MTDPPDGDGSGVYAELAVRPDCPVATVASDVPLREFLPATGSGLPQFIVERSAGAPVEHDGLEPVMRTGESVVCRLTGDVRCDREGCPACAPGTLPLDPIDVHWVNGELRLHVAAEDGEGVRRCVDAVSDEFEVEPVRFSTAGALSRARHRVVLDLDGLTERQRELARAAVDRGYFEVDGPSAAVVAEELGISKSTLSEHLRAVQRELFDQLFAGTAREEG